MAISVSSLGTVNSKTAAWRSTTNVVATGTWSDGDLIVVIIASDLPLKTDGPTWPVLIYDGASKQAVLDAEADNAGNACCQIWSCTNVSARSGNGTINIYNENDSDANNNICATAYAITGIATASALDKTNTNTGTGTDASTNATGELSQADEAVVAASAVEDEIDDSHGTWSGVTGNEQFDATNGGGDASNTQVHSVIDIVSATTSKTGTDAGHDSNDWAACIASYKALGGPPPPGGATPARVYNIYRGMKIR